MKVLKTNTRLMSILALLVLAGAPGLKAQTVAKQLAITNCGGNVILTWPTNVAGFDYSRFTLQSTTNLVSPVIWNPVSPLPVIVDGRAAVTNPISGTQQFYRLIESAIPSGMALIPARTFTMGDTLDDESDAIPTNVTVSAFYMDVNLVCYGHWQSVYNWATNNGYGFNNTGSGKATNQPAMGLNWFDAVKWCNARSQRAGLAPVYFTDPNLTRVYTNGVVLQPYVNWTNCGYRLPTEAEWEKAARGGLSGLRFPWGDTISESQANYNSTYTGSSPPAYDLGPPGYNSIGMIGGMPYTSPVGSFAANGYGLYDMAGNVFEYCWDWYAAPPYPNGSPYLGGTDPRGPAFESNVRVLRGGCWFFNATLSARCAVRYSMLPNQAGSFVGFRCVRGSSLIGTTD
jgi:formylglycine-generating enzyme required for sulfatase activity